MLGHFRTVVLSPSRPKYYRRSVALIHNGGMKTFNEKIKQLRRARGLTQAEVAKAIGITQKGVSKLENTRGQIPTGKTLTGLAALYDVDPMSLLSKDELRQSASSLTQEEAELLLLYRSLTDAGQKFILGRARELHAEDHARREATSEPRRRASDKNGPSEDERHKH